MVWTDGPIDARLLEGAAVVLDFGPAGTRVPEPDDTEPDVLVVDAESVGPRRSSLRGRE